MITKVNAIAIGLLLCSSLVYGAEEQPDLNDDSRQAGCSVPLSTDRTELEFLIDVKLHYSFDPDLSEILRFTITPETTGEELQCMIEKERQLPISRQRPLIHKGQTVDPLKSLASKPIGQGDVVHVVVNNYHYITEILDYREAGAA